MISGNGQTVTFASTDSSVEATFKGSNFGPRKIIWSLLFALPVKPPRGGLKQSDMPNMGSPAKSGQIGSVPDFGEGGILIGLAFRRMKIVGQSEVISNM